MHDVESVRLKQVFVVVGEGKFVTKGDGLVVGFQIVIERDWLAGKEDGRVTTSRDVAQHFVQFVSPEVFEDSAVGYKKRKRHGV